MIAHEIDLCDALSPRQYKEVIHWTREPIRYLMVFMSTIGEVDLIDEEVIWEDSFSSKLFSLHNYCLLLEVSNVLEEKEGYPPKLLIWDTIVVLPSQYNKHDFDNTWEQVVVVYHRINAVRNHFVDSPRGCYHPNGLCYIISQIQSLIPCTLGSSNLIQLSHWLHTFQTSV